MPSDVGSDPKEELRRLAGICAQAKIVVKVTGMVNGVMVTMTARGRKKTAESGISYKDGAKLDEAAAYKQLLPMFRMQMQKVLKSNERGLRKARFKM